MSAARCCNTGGYVLVFISDFISVYTAFTILYINSLHSLLSLQIRNRQRYDLFPFFRLKSLSLRLSALSPIISRFYPSVASAC